MFIINKYSFVCLLFISYDSVNADCIADPIAECVNADMNEIRLPAMILARLESIHIFLVSATMRFESVSRSMRQCHYTDELKFRTKYARITFN